MYSIYMKVNHWQILILESLPLEERRVMTKKGHISVVVDTGGGYTVIFPLR